MSTSEAPFQGRFPLTLPADPDQTVTVYGANYQIVWQGNGAQCKVLELDAGLYIVRAEANGLLTERIVRLTQAADLSDMRTPRRSAAPLVDSALYRDCDADAVRRFSLERTTHPLALAGCSASLLIFVRALDSGASRVGKDLTLLDANGDVLCAFEPGQTASSTGDGYMVFSADAPPGLYRLVSNHPAGREVPVYLFPGFQTRVFVPEKRYPLLEAMRVLLDRSTAAFDPQSPVAQATDAALESIMNSSRRLPRAVIEQISGPRFDNPLFRLIATYTHARWMLSRGEPWRPDDELVLEFDVALASLAHDLPGCPDLSALQALRGEVVGQPAGVAPLASPPMFRLGLNAILRGTLRDPSLVAEGSLLDRISERMLNDSPWTSWSPIGRPHPLTGRGVVPGCDVVPDEMAGMDGDDSEHMGWLREHVLGALKRRVLRKLTRSDQQLSLVELAGTARTTPMAVRRAVQDLVRSVESDGVDRLRLHPELARWLKSEAGRNDLFRLMNER